MRQCPQGYAGCRLPSRLASDSDAPRGVAGPAWSGQVLVPLPPRSFPTIAGTSSPVAADLAAVARRPRKKSLPTRRKECLPHAEKNSLPKGGKKSLPAEEKTPYLIRSKTSYRLQATSCASSLGTAGSPTFGLSATPSQAQTKRRRSLGMPRRTIASFATFWKAHVSLARDRAPVA